MAKNIRRMLAMVLVMCMFVSALPLQALAAEGDGTVIDGPNTETVDGMTVTTTTTTTQTTDDTSGNTTVTVTIQQDTNGTTDTGATLERHETDTKTETTNANGVVVGSSGVNSGSETITNEIPLPEVGMKLDVPLTSVDDPETEEKENVSTESFADNYKDGVTGDLQNGEDDPEYNQTTTTVTPNSVTVTTNKVEVTETIVEKEVDENGNVIKGTDLDYVVSEVTPNKNNDLFIWVYTGQSDPVPPKDNDEVYEYKYLGTGNTSKLQPVYFFETPEEPDEEPAYIDAAGNKYYFHGQGGVNFDNAYQNGEHIEADMAGTFSVPQQFILVDEATGELITTYCADASTPTLKGYNYNIENLEDATYYNDEQAAMIRTIANNGYWGTTGTEVDDDGNEVPKKGSLEAMKQMLLDSGKFGADELESLTDGVALTATQMAIWTFSNANSDIVFFNAFYTKESDENCQITTAYAKQLLQKDPKALSEEQKKSVDLMYKLYDFMINMDPTPASSDDKKPTTNDTFINADNFIDNMSVTVIEKAEGHGNNQDDIDTNDAYVTNLTFALVVTPSTDNGDDLVVKVVDTNNNVIASGRIAGEAKEGEILLTPDENGNYCFAGITMIEGEHSFKLNLEGVQNLKKGVYLYTSEVRTSEDNEEVSSQTLVGLAGGKHAVNVSLDIKFELDVTDGVVATEHIWRDEYDPGYTPPTPDTPVPANYEPETPPQVFRLANQAVEEIPEEPVPLAAPVVTGDNSGLWIAVIMLSLFAMVAINLFDKKRQHEAF